MCMYLTNGNFLGQRLIGYEFYDSKSKGFVGMTEKQVITKLKNNEKVYGFFREVVEEFLIFIPLSPSAPDSQGTLYSHLLLPSLNCGT